MITHIVFFKLKDNSKESISKTKEVLESMQGKIDNIKHLEIGIDVLQKDRSYDVALVAKFDTLEDLHAYDVHPVHQEIVKYIGTVKESVISVDYESNLN